MKKFSLVFLIIILSFTFMVGCKPKEENTEFYKYFNNFTSRGEFTSAKKTLSLGKNCFFETYDYTNNVFTISEWVNPDKTEKEEALYLYGFASETEELIKPIYISVLETYGDYAIVTKAIGENNKLKNKVGLVKFRGTNKGKEYGFVSDYIENSFQYQFLSSKYISIVGGVIATDNKKDFSIIYDYNNDYGLLEVGQVITTSAYQMQLNDEYLTVLGNNEIKYYNLKKIDSDGRYRLINSYIPFPEADYPSDTFWVSNMTMSNYYIGNGWFIRDGLYSTDKEYSGYQFTRTVDGKISYMMENCERYNINSGNVIKSDKVAFVANKYNSDLYRSYADMNNATPPTLSKLPIYLSPSLPLSDVIKDGYSLVYYYFNVGNNKEAQISFAVYDNKANSINLNTLGYPLLFVDKNAVQIAEPSLSPMYGNLETRDYFDNVKTYDFATENSIAFESVLTVGGIVYGNKITFTDKNVDSSLGAYDINGNLVVPFKYYELTPFLGDYATGSYLKANDSTSRVFVRLSKNGEETELSNIYALKNGVYITSLDKKFTLYNNSGKVLLEGCDLISPFEMFLMDGQFIKTIVSTNENGSGNLYILE